MGFVLLPGCGGQTSAVQGQQARSAWSRSWDTGWTSGDPGGLLPRTFRILSRCIFPSDLSLTRLFKRAEALRFAVVTFELLFQGAGPFLWQTENSHQQGHSDAMPGCCEPAPQPQPAGRKGLQWEPLGSFLPAASLMTRRAVKGSTRTPTAQPCPALYQPSAASLTDRLFCPSLRGSGGADRVLSRFLCCAQAALP